MTFRTSGPRRCAAAWGAAPTILIVAAAIVAVTMAPAQAQRSQLRKQPESQQMQRETASPQRQQDSSSQSRVQVSAEFRTALEPYGRWQQHSRWGDIWIPANRSRDWRPYTLGHWVYTDDWGWYWISDNSEARWGWATYHYGRWVFDDDLGWCWVAGDEWSPGWVQWRRGEGDATYVGWSPLPPDEVIVTYRDEPRFWIFVRARDFVAPRIASVILPVRQYDVFIRQTVLVNRTVVISDRGRFAVNPGIEPNMIAKFSGRPLRTFDVRPVVLAGTAQIPGAMQVRAQDVRSKNFRGQTTMRQTQNTVRAADRVQAPQPLAAGERGRLGDNPPRAAEDRPSTTGKTPGARDQQPQQGQQQEQRQQPQGRKEPTRRQEGRSPERGGTEQQQPAPADRRGTEQREQRQQPGRQAVEPQRAPRTEGRSGAEQQQQAPADRRGTEQREQRQQPGRQAVEPQRAPRTEGRGAEQRQQRQPEPRAVERQRQEPSSQRSGARPEQNIDRGRGGPPQAAPQPRGQPGITEGRGGGGARVAPQGGRGGGPGGAATEGRGGPGR